MTTFAESPVTADEGGRQTLPAVGQGQVSTSAAARHRPHSATAAARRGEAQVRLPAVAPSLRLQAAAVRRKHAALAVWSTRTSPLASHPSTRDSSGGDGRDEAALVEGQLPNRQISDTNAPRIVDLNWEDIVLDVADS